MRISGRDIVLALMGLAGIGLLLWTFGAGETRMALERVEPLRLLAYLLLSATVFGAMVARWRGIATALGVRVGTGRLVAARLAGDAVGSLVPSARLAGDPVRIAWLVRAGADGPRAGASVALDRAAEMAGNAVCATAYVSIALPALVGAAAHGTDTIVIALLGASLLFLAAPFAMLYGGVRPFAPLYGVAWIEARPRLAAWVAALRNSEQHAMRLVQERPRVLAWALLATMAIEALILAEYYLLLRAFGIAVDLPTLLLVLVGTGVARAVPTPGALGSLEATQTAVFATAMGDPAQGIAAGIVLRLHETLWTLLGLAALFAWRRDSRTSDGRTDLRTGGAEPRIADESRRDAAPTI